MRYISIVAAIAVLSACSGEVLEPHDEAPAPPRFEVVSDDPGEHGERLFAVLGCIGCHTPDLTGEDWSEPALGTLWTANLTQSAAKWSPEELTAMITEGKRPDRALIDMPSALFTEMNPDDIAALVAYMKTLKPTGEVRPDPTIGPQLQTEIDAGEFMDSVQTVKAMRGQSPPDTGETHSYGRFIVRATCVECHGIDLRGGELKMEGVNKPVDLRMVAAYSPEEFATLMTEGKPVGGRELSMMGGVARWRYSRFTDAERDAVYGYLAELARREP